MKDNGFGVREETTELGECREVLVNGKKRAGDVSEVFKR